MDRQAFKQRMQQLKQYREQNPGKTYLEWKQQLPENLQDESSYNLKRAYELGYEPEVVEGDSLKHLPTRDQETGEILKKPWHPTFLIRSSYKGITPKVKRPIPKVNRAAEQLEKDRIIEAARREQYLKPKARNEGYKVVERLQDDPDYFNRAMQVRKQFGDNYMRTYADLISTYNTNPSKLPQVELTSNLPNARAQMGATTSAANRHMAGGEFPRMEEFNYRIDPTKTDLSGNVTEHEWNHLVDYLTNKTPGASGNSNLFYKMSEDISNNKIDKHFEYYMRPTEQKAYMNQIREYLFNSGKINRRGDKVDAKLLQQTLDTLKDTDTYGSAVRASKQFKNINKYTKWFNSIPLLGLGTAAVYKGTEQNE